MTSLIKRWFTPSTTTAADVAKLRADVDIAVSTARIARLELAELRRTTADWQQYTQGLAKVVLAQDRELAALKSAHVPAGLDGRLARLELMLLPAQSDGAVELSEAAERALKRALDGMGGVS